MSTSLLFHAFWIRGYQLKKYEFSKGDIFFHVNQDKHNLRCPHCPLCQHSCPLTWV